MVGRSRPLKNLLGLLDETSVSPWGTERSADRWKPATMSTLLRCELFNHDGCIVSHHFGPLLSRNDGERAGLSPTGSWISREGSAVRTSSNKLERESTPVRGFYCCTKMFTTRSVGHGYREVQAELLPLSDGSGIGAVVIGRLYSASGTQGLHLPRPVCLSQRD